MTRHLQTLLICIISLCTFQQTIAQIEFNTESWSEVLKQSKESNKPIFVDVYTNWCGPCKKMDKVAFADPEIGQLMNGNFINVKWDADHVYFNSLVKQYGVTGYPTFLYIDHDGNVIRRRTGYRDTKAFRELSQEVINFQNKDHNSEVSALMLKEDLTKEDVFTALKNLNGFYHAQKPTLFNIFIKKLDGEKTISHEEYEVIVDNMTTPQHLKYAVGYFPINAADQDAANKQRTYLSVIKAQIKRNFEQALRYKDKELLDSTAYLNELFTSKTNQNNIVNNSIRENNAVFLEFYQKHRYKDEFAELAEHMVDEEIIPFPPELLKEKDHENMKILHQHTDNRNASAGKQIPRFRMYDQHRFAFKAASKLNEVAETMNIFFKDHAHLEKALEWIELSNEYLDLPEARLTRAKILVKLGYKNEAKMHVAKGLESNYLNKKIRSDLSKLEKSLL